MTTVNVRGFGSLVNALENQTRSLTPEVGMGVTELCYSDRHPYTVVAILGPNRIQVTRDIAIRSDDRGACESQDYRYTPQPDGPRSTLRMNKTGRWKMVGDPQGSTYLVGKREEYYDFTR